MRFHPSFWTSAAIAKVGQRTILTFKHITKHMVTLALEHSIATYWWPAGLPADLKRTCI